MCNLDRECAGGEDELNCPYTGRCGQHRMTTGGRCYQLFRNRFASWIRANSMCARLVLFVIHAFVQATLHFHQLSWYETLGKCPYFTGTVTDKDASCGIRRGWGRWGWRVKGGGAGEETAVLWAKTSLSATRGTKPTTMSVGRLTRSGLDHFQTDSTQNTTVSFAWVVDMVMRGLSLRFELLIKAEICILQFIRFDEVLTHSVRSTRWLVTANLVYNLSTGLVYAVFFNGRILALLVCDWKDHVTVNQSSCGFFKTVQITKYSDLVQVSPDRIKWNSNKTCSNTTSHWHTQCYTQGIWAFFSFDFSKMNQRISLPKCWHHLDEVIDLFLNCHDSTFSNRRSWSPSAAKRPGKIMPFHPTTSTSFSVTTLALVGCCHEPWCGRHLMVARRWFWKYMEHKSGMRKVLVKSRAQGCQMSLHNHFDIQGNFSK